MRTKIRRHGTLSINKRLKHTPNEPDLFSSLPMGPAEKQRMLITPEEILAESGVILNAGKDTTQSALTNTIYELAVHYTTQQKLREELRDQLAANDIPITSYKKLQHIAYLRAVIDETFRLHPPLGTGLPRVTVEPSLIAGELIAAAVIVSAQTWSLHRREDLFPNSHSWLPERWFPDNTDFTDQNRLNLTNYVLPFSLGPRACIGRNLAYVELSICLAALVLAFEWELAEEGAELRHHERFNCNPIELPVPARALV